MSNSAPAADIIQVIKHPDLIGDTISVQQEILLRALYGLPLPEGLIETRRFKVEKCSTCGATGKVKDGEREVACGDCDGYGEIPEFYVVKETAEEFFCRATKRDSYEPREYSEAGIYLGARSGKSDKLAANIAIYEACFRKHKRSRGEIIYIPVIATDKKQARIVYRYIRDKVRSSAALSGEIQNVKAEEIEMSDGVIIGVHPCSFRQLRGYTIPCAVPEEVAVWRDEETGANPAKEVIRALKRGMLTMPNSKLIKISSPFAKSGVVWDDCKNQDKLGHILIVRLPCWEINPILSEKELISEYRKDPEFFWREFGAEFWEARSAAFPAEKVDACTVQGRFSVKYNSSNVYHVVVDVAWKRDNFTFLVCHRQGAKVVIDRMRTWTPARKETLPVREVLSEVVLEARAYGQSIIHGDQYCAPVVRQFLLDMGVDYRERVTTPGRSGTKQTMYGNLRVLLLSENVELLDDPATNAELKGLEAITGPEGSVRYQAPPGGKDDRATVVALGAQLCIEGRSSADAWTRALGSINKADPEELEAGAVVCVDCGKKIPINVEFYGIGAETGQCFDCHEDHGAPTYNAFKPPEGESRPVEEELLV